MHAFGVNPEVVNPDFSAIITAPTSIFTHLRIHKLTHFNLQTLTRIHKLTSIFTHLQSSVFHFISNLNTQYHIHQMANLQVSCIPKNHEVLWLQGLENQHRSYNLFTDGVENPLKARRCDNHYLITLNLFIIKISRRKYSSI